MCTLNGGLNTVHVHKHAHFGEFEQQLTCQIQYSGKEYAL